MDDQTPRPPVLVVIPARGGSKGLPRKNLACIAGVPLVGRTVLAARRASRVGRVVVSTDSVEIAQEARRYGAEIVERPDELSSHTATSESAVLHALEVLEQAEDYHPEWVVLAQCTSPFTTSADFDAAIARVEATGADSCFTASKFFHFVWEEREGHAVGINHDGGPRKRRQDLAPQFLENGAVYVMRVSLFRATRHRFCGRTVLAEVPTKRTYEIDAHEELVAARALAAARGERSLIQTLLPARVEALFLDFDGVLTDDGVTVGEDGSESVKCSRADGLGLAAVRRLGVPILIVSKERNTVVKRRADKLMVECLQAVDDKASALRSWCAENKVDIRNTVFVGNDVNDLPCMLCVPASFCPSDARDEVQQVARGILQGRGGRGAVREICDAVAAQVRSCGQAQQA